jgi:hypothetical protein
VPSQSNPNRIDDAPPPSHNNSRKKKMEKTKSWRFILFIFIFLSFFSCVSYYPREKERKELQQHVTTHTCVQVWRGKDNRSLLLRHRHNESNHCLFFFFLWKLYFFFIFYFTKTIAVVRYDIKDNKKENDKTLFSMQFVCTNKFDQEKRGRDKNKVARLVISTTGFPMNSQTTKGNKSHFPYVFFFSFHFLGGSF